MSQKPDSESPPPLPRRELTPPKSLQGGEGDAFPVAVEHHCLAMFSDPNPDWLEIPRTATGIRGARPRLVRQLLDHLFPSNLVLGYLVVVRHTTKATPLLGQPTSPRWHDARSTTSTLTGRNFISPLTRRRFLHELTGPRFFHLFVPSIRSKPIPRLEIGRFFERFSDSGRIDRRAGVVLGDLGSGEGRVGGEASRHVIESSVAESLDGVEEEKEEEEEEIDRRASVEEIGGERKKF